MEPDFKGETFELTCNYNSFYSDRNYDGIKHFKPKGMPENVQKKMKYWGDDGHTHSWLTLKELCDFREGMSDPE